MIEGIDVSGGAQGTIHWPSVRTEGIDFAYCKASQGSGFVDQRYRQNIAEAKAVDIVTGAYHFWRWDADPSAQASNFLSVVGPIGPDSLPPMLDIETERDGAGHISKPVPALIDGIARFIDIVQHTTGRRCGIYTYPAAWHETLENTTQFAAQPLWIADYTPPAGPFPGGWKDYAFWQYTSTGEIAQPGGAKMLVDRDHFNGTADQLRAYCQSDGGDAGLPLRVPGSQHPVVGAFKTYWLQNGGLSIFGLPITDARTETLSDGNAYLVQWFERCRMELHGDKVELGLVGAELLAMKH